jgi:hypothetical protein
MAYNALEKYKKSFFTDYFKCADFCFGFLIVNHAKRRITCRRFGRIMVLVTFGFVIKDKSYFQFNLQRILKISAGYQSFLQWHY